MMQVHRIGRIVPFHSLLLVCLALLLAPAYALPEKGSQRSDFLEAEKALRKGEMQRYQTLKQELSEYPLLPYLELQHLQKRLHQANNSEVRAFLDRHRGAPVADLLRREWLDRLASRKDWDAYLAFYTPQGSTRRQCNHLRALLATGQTGKAWPLVEKIWLHGRSRPTACDPAFKAWENAGKRTPELTWKRIALAMQAGQWRLARYLGKKLEKSEQTWVQHWIALHKDPKKALRSSDFSRPHPFRESILAHAVDRLSRRDGLAALDLWQTLQRDYRFPQHLRTKTERRLALALERNPSEDAYAFINSLTPPENDTRYHVACFRAALLRQDWQQILSRLQQWSASERNTDRWKYWQARALTLSGKPELADPLFSQVAESRSYYGFLAADQVGAPYHLKHQETPENPALRQRFEKHPGMARAFELHALKRDVQARREWNYATRGLEKAELKAAALIARDRNWLDQAIFTLAKTGYWDDLELRFPLEYRELVASEAASHTLDMAWIYAVMRQESAFMRDARSHAGALGLMQLMPATARSVATRQLKRKPPKKSQLLKPSMNIALGSAYLKQLKKKLGDNPVLATAAYNAGPHRVSKWLPQENLAADIWVELVPFSETQRYLKRVMSYMVIYDKRLGREPKRLKERMLPIVALGGGARIAGS